MVRALLDGHLAAWLDGSFAPPMIIVWEESAAVSAVNSSQTMIMDWIIDQKEVCIVVDNPRP